MKLDKCSDLQLRNDVIIFRDVLFLHQKDRAQRQFQMLMGEDTLDQRVIDNFQNNIAHNVSIATREGFDYKHIVFPCKPIVYKEQFQSIGVELNSIFSDKHNHPQVLYPKLLPTDYFLGDSHSNVFGTLKIINQVLVEFGYPKLPEPILKDHAVIGDLRKMLGEEEKVIVKSLKGLKGLPINTLARYSLGQALKGNTGKIQFHFNPYALYNRRLVLFGTSSFFDRSDVYQRIFSEVVFVRTPYILDDIVKILEPDMVLTGNAERHLYNVPDCDKPIPWFMNYISDRYDSKLLRETDIKAFTALFSGKDSRAYKNMFGSKLSDLPRCIDKLSELSDNDITTDADINFIKGMASHYIDTHPRQAYYLMRLAHNIKT